MKTPIARATLAAALWLSLLTPRAAHAELGPVPTTNVWHAAKLWGADVRSLVVVPDRPDVVFAGTSGGHIYVSRDGGQTWQDPGVGQPFLGWVISALRFDPNRPARLWAGLWGVWGGGLVAFSDDDGATWSFRQGPPVGGQVYSLALVSGTPGKVLVGTREGVWASLDDAETWTSLSKGLPSGQKVTSLLVDAIRPRTFFAGTWRRAYRSDDAGATWKGVFEGMELDREVFTLNQSPTHPDELWVSTCGWVYRSQDRGGKWTRHREGLAANRTPSFAILGAGQLLAGTVNGLYRSADEGATWQKASREDLAVLAIAHHPARPQRILLGTEGSGVWRSEDGGKSFAAAPEGMTNVQAGALTHLGSEILVAVNHAGPASGIYSSIDGGASFQLQRGELPTVLALATLGPRAYAATERGLFERGPDYAWKRVPEVPEERIEELASRAGSLLVRSKAALWESHGGAFTPVVYKHKPPVSATLFGGAAWVADGEAVHLLAGGSNHSIWAPAPEGTLVALPERVLLAGRSAVWERRGSDAKWVRLASEATRIVPTGDRRFSHLAVASDAARLFDEESGTYQAVKLPFPAQQLAAALVVTPTGKPPRLLLGSTASGVWWGAVGEAGSARTDP